MTGADPFQTPEPFEIDVEPHRETIVVTPRGEVDVTSAAALRERVEQLLAAGFRRVVVDLRNVSFMDSTGLHAVLGADHASRQAGVEFALIHGPRAVRRLFEVTGMETSIAFIEPGEIDWPAR